MAFQLVACGNVRGGGNEQDPRDPARPEHAAAAAPRAAEPLLGGAAQPVVPADPEPVVAPRDVDPVASADPEPVVPAEPGWEAARCGGAATRHIRMVGQLYPMAYMPELQPFNAERPELTASFSSSLTAFDDQGRPQDVAVYFSPRADRWDYHAVLVGTPFVIGAGDLFFDDKGIATVVETQELRLLTATGPGHAIELDVGGMQLAETSTIFEQERDGREARWGTTCASSEPLPTPTVVAGPACASAATTRLTLRANLTAASPIATPAWDPHAPTAELTVPLQANDASGTLIEFQLELRRSSDDSWDYHVLPLGDASELEVASGALHFNANGSLRSVTATRPLRFPNHDGVLGALIDLDFGASTDAGGNGVDGVTALPGGSFEVWQRRDGAVLDCAPRASPSLRPLAHVPSCAGERTTRVGLNFNLDPGAALSNTTPVHSASVAVYDAALAPQQLDLHFRHLEAGRWQCQVIALSQEVGVVELRFTANGAPELVENIPTLRLPLADGSAGPPIELGFDDGWAITSFAAGTFGWLQPDGAAPHADSCVE